MMTANSNESPTLLHRSAISNDCVEKHSLKQSDDDQKNRIDFTKWRVNESAKFSLRVTISLTLASLFTLCFDPDDTVYPDALWVYITAGVVSWQPTSDTGSVLKKAWQRMLGTFLGGIAGLGVGAVSLTFPEYGSSGQAAYLGISNTVLSFVVIYLACELGFKGHYSSVLGSFTFGMALLAFYSSDAETAWRVAIFRIVNIVVGCLIGSLVSLVVFPVSTKFLVESSLLEAINQAGRTAKEVLSSFEDGLPSFQSIILNDLEEDAGRVAYKKGIDQIHKIKALFHLLEYDPLFTRISKGQRKDVIDVWRVKLGRTMRIQMTIYCLDNIVRSRLTGNDMLNYQLLRRVGNNVDDLLNDSKPREDRDQAALILLKDDLPGIKREIALHKDCVPGTTLEEYLLTADDIMRRLSKFDEDSTTTLVNLFSMNQTCLFYQMVEALIIRCIRLHHVPT